MLRNTTQSASSSGQGTSGAGQPWYAPPKKASQTGKQGQAGAKKSSLHRTREVLDSIFNVLLSLVFALICGYFLGLIRTSGENFLNLAAYAAAIGMGLCAAVYFAIRQIGNSLQRAQSQLSSDSSAHVAIRFFKGELQFDESRNGIPAPELALQQFVQQVRAYATEKSYQKNRQDNPKLQNASPLLQEPVDLLRRRWNEVMDSLNEFEIFLANDPKGMITKLVNKFPNQNIDISQVFRDVSDTFDNTWRKKGINIESAIVTPLKANTNEALLRRLLVGPWRACAYFARRGGGVLFSAKAMDRSSGGAVLARWECEGLMIPEEYLKIATDMERTVNERIEIGLEKIAPDPTSPNTLHALISFVTWIDLVQTIGAEYHFKHTNEGFAIELILK